MAGSGTATVTFGSLVAAKAGAKAGPQTHATYTQTGQTGILTGSLVEAWLRAEPAGTSDHVHGELIALAEDLDIIACNIVAGTGFDIIVRHRRGGVYGAVLIDWAWY